MTNGLLIVVVSTALIVACLWVERALHERLLRKMPLRICVTGTRGKSSVTRLIAAALKEAGQDVLAKTTGSQAALILPDGSEREIQRRGSPTILEQKKVVRLAARLGVKALVVEMMSIRRECLFVESQQLLRPHTLVLTNVRLDHVDLMGKTREDIAKSLSFAFPSKGRIIVPEEEIFPVFKDRAARLFSTLEASRQKAQEQRAMEPSLDYEEFEENLRLALKTANCLGIEETTALRGMAAVRPDFGRLKAWKATEGTEEAGCVFVNAFAANDPGSTLKAVGRMRERKYLEGKVLIGLLNLRRDRGDRTEQWAKAIEDGEFDLFDRIAAIGPSARAFSFKMRKANRAAGKIVVLSETAPIKIFREIAALASGPAVIVGMGNIGGLGRAIVAHWEKTGVGYGF